MNSREKMLDTIRRNKPSGAVALPEKIAFGYLDGDLARAFSEVLRSIGGEVIGTENPADIELALQKRFGHLKNAVSLLNGHSSLKNIADPHELAGIELAVLQGRFGVAENGAVWLTEADMGGHRVLPFITQHLAIFLKKRTSWQYARGIRAH